MSTVNTTAFRPIIERSKYHIQKASGMVELTFNGYNHIKEHDVLQALTDVRSCIDSELKPARLVLDIRGLLSLEQDARRQIAESCSMHCVAQVALMVSSPISKLIGGFVKTNIHRSIPIEVFECRNEAKTWLLK